MFQGTISAIIITKNEGQNLQGCLDSLKFCNEWIVVDSGSTDGTTEIASSLGAQVMTPNDWPGFGLQKQRALDAAKGEWVLSIDADERITSELAEEILSAIESSSIDGFYIKRRSQFLGKWLNHGGWYPDRVLRLAKRNKTRFDLAPVHEKMLVNGPVGELESPMLHYSYRSLEDVLVKQKTYALAGASKMIAQGQVANQLGILRALLSAAWTFVRLFFLKLGFLDGWHGLVAAIAKSQETFWKYLALAWPGDRSRH